MLFLNLSSAGYILQAVEKILQGSTKGTTMVVPPGFDGDEEHTDNEEWFDLINRGSGGLTCVNDTTFQVFLAMVIEFRKHLGSQQISNFKTHISSREHKGSV